MLEPFVNSTIAGFNNPDCAFFVGSFAGSILTYMTIFRIALVYFGLRLLDKIIFSGIPKLYKFIKNRKGEKE